MKTLRDCVALVGPALTPRRVSRFEWSGDTITRIDIHEPVPSLDAGALVVIPGLYNGHTHLGDSALPDGATGLTLEEAFFRPAGYKYRQLAKLGPEAHLAHIVAHHRHFARAAGVCHLDFREQGAKGAELLRRASIESGVEAIILNQFENSPQSRTTLDANSEKLPESVLAELRAMLAVADGFSESTMNDLTDAAWTQIRAETSTLGKLRAIHCLESDTYRNRSLEIAGVGDLQRAIERYDPHLIVHLTVANAEEIARVAASGKTVALNPRANAALGLPLPPLADLLRSGTNLLLGTDNGMLNSPALFAELDFSYKLAKSQFADALSPKPVDILRMVTSNVRNLLGGDHYGYLEVGLPASFAIIDFHAGHLAHTRNLLASLVTRVTPADVSYTAHRGRTLWCAPHFPPFA